MKIGDVQHLLASVGYYRGPISGRLGPETRAAVAIVERNAGGWPSFWSDERRAYAAGQRVLAAAGFPVGAIDGQPGPNTGAALDAWKRTRDGKPVRILKAPAPVPAAAPTWPRYGDLTSAFGPAGGPRATAGTVRLPFPFVIAWDPSQRVSSFKAHELVAPTFQRVFENAAAHYGEDEFRRLRLDRFGGCFNDRVMRGGTRKSTHAWGAAVDLDPENNQLKWGRSRASFARPEFNAFWRIVEAEGLVSLGRTQDRDWMHFQAVKP